MYNNPETKQNGMYRKVLVSLSEMFTTNKLGNRGVLVKSEECLRLIKASQVWYGIFPWSSHHEKSFYYQCKEVWPVCCLNSLMVPVKEELRKQQ